MEQWLALLDCLRETGSDELALDVAAKILAREPDHSDVRMMRAELLEKNGRTDDAAKEWQAYVNAAPPDAAPETVAGVHERLAKHALGVGDRGQAMMHYEAAYQLTPEALQIVRGMRQLQRKRRSLLGCRSVAVAGARAQQRCERAARAARRHWRVCSASTWVTRRAP